MIRDIGYMKILKTGPGTSIQDLGRVGFAQFGVPNSGVLDLRSFAWVNYLLQNEESDAALEICQPGLKVQFGSPTLICLAGAKVAIKLNGNVLSNPNLLPIQANDLLEIGSMEIGAVLYLGIKNGFQTEKIMNSRSWFGGITQSDFAKKEERISYFTNQEIPKFTASKVKRDTSWLQEKIITAYPGPQWDLLDKHSQEKLETSEFTISDLKNRMAIQLTELLPNNIPEMATAPVFPGTVQLTSGGKLLVLMKDAQVTGGYPRILQLTENAISLIAQKKPQEKIKFSVKKLG
ncbi:biotin-dependent carboxyltransferase family protein [Algoriphagus yeomjeoni]|uniref:5-oxoprolinase subunit C family protein n=1 Tax=Algoriphagus yeomjeoni TaxID=291403 RepID=UPI003CE4BCB4